MERADDFYIMEWRIENLSHWCVEVHGDCIRSPKMNLLCVTMELYPKGIGGQGEHLVMRFCDLYDSFSCELSFNCSDGSLHCSKQQVNARENKGVLELPPGPKIDDVLSRIREDFITVRLRRKNPRYFDRRMCTTINGLKMSLKMNPRGMEEFKSKGTDCFYFINFTPNNFRDRLELNTCSVNDKINFLIKPPTEFEYPFAVEMSVSLTGSDDTVDNCVKKEHVFRDNSSSWTFPYPLEKKALVGKEISLSLCLKTKNAIQSLSSVNWNYRYISIDTNDIPCLSDGVCLSMNPKKVEVLTKDSRSKTSLKSDMPDDSVLVLSNELMCLYQDQKYSDFQLKCDNVTFPVHRAILSARSPVLDHLLSSDMKEASSGTVDIGDLDPSTLSRFLTYIYTGSVEDLQCDRALKLYNAADKYLVPSLRRDCSKYLCANVSVSNVCDILSLGDRHQDDELTAASHDFILDNYTDVLKSNEWESFMCREPLLAVKTVTHFASKDRVRMHDPK